jgi:hypothetical protein
MRLTKEVQNFSSSCERLIFEADASKRHLREEEVLLVEFYCREVLKKVVKRSPPRQQGESSGIGHRSNTPSSSDSSEGRTSQVEASSGINSRPLLPVHDISEVKYVPYRFQGRRSYVIGLLFLRQSPG